MTIEETYKGMWSSDPDLLKSLLDAGETIIAKRKSSEFLVELSIRDGKSYVQTLDELNPVKEIKYANWSFLIPPRPLVLEPKPLQWHHHEMNEEAIAVDGQWVFYAWNNGDWEIHCSGVEVAMKWGNENDDLDFDTAKAAIHEWRVNHLKSMIEAI